MKELSIDLNGETKKVWAQKLNGTLWVHFDGQTIAYEPESKKRKAGQSEAGDDSVILSPMPGKILKVNFAEGDAVQKGDVIVSMEAMKMEYSLAAGKEGIISSINCADGDQVQLEEVLVEIGDANV